MATENQTSNFLDNLREFLNDYTRARFLDEYPHTSGIESHFGAGFNFAWKGGMEDFVFVASTDRESVEGFSRCLYAKHSVDLMNMKDIHQNIGPVNAPLVIIHGSASDFNFEAFMTIISAAAQHCYDVNVVVSDSLTFSYSD